MRLHSANSHDRRRHPRRWERRRPAGSPPLDDRLEALDEDEELQVDDGDLDGEAGVGEQFVRLWYAYVDDDPSFGGDAQASDEHLLDVLESACLSGMAPHHLKRDALPPLLPIAAELARDRQALIARNRAHSRRFGR